MYTWHILELLWVPPASLFQNSPGMISTKISFPPHTSAALSPEMNSTSPDHPPPTPPGDGSGKKVRKPYTITKCRESWTEEEHDKFLEALQLLRQTFRSVNALFFYMKPSFDRDWKRIEDFVGSKSVIQIRSHAQKYFLKVQKNGSVAHVPPPRPKRKASHPYPQKASKNVLVPLLQASIPYRSSSAISLQPGYPAWDDVSVLVDNLSCGPMPSEKEYSILGFEADNGSTEAATISNCSMSGFGSSSGASTSSELIEQGKQDSMLLGIPDFAEVYSFIGSVFDPDGKDHLQKLKEMDPMNFETVLLLMRNLTINMSGPDFEPIRECLSSYDVHEKSVEVSPGTVISAE